MPLKSGYSRETFEANFRTLRVEGKPRAQALKIAYENAKRSFWKRYPDGTVPAWMVRPGESRLDPRRRRNPIGMLPALSAATSAHYLATQVNPKRKRNPARKSYAIEIAEWTSQNDLDVSVYEAMMSEFESDPASYDGGDMFDLYQAACKPRGKHPVPPSKKVQVRDAADLYTRFTGHDALESIEIEKPELPDVMLVVGDIDGIMYTTVRDGKVEKYVHQFKKKARPLFCVSHDGKQIYLVGGEYDFTERGIVDRT